MLAILLALAFLLPVGPVLTITLLAFACVVASVGWVSLTTLLASETPAGRGTTMIFNGVLFNLGGAAGGALGGVLIAHGGYGALGIGFSLFTLGSALLVWRPRQRAIATPAVTVQAADT